MGIIHGGKKIRKELIEQKCKYKRKPVPHLTDERVLKLVAFFSPGSAAAAASAVSSEASVPASAGRAAAVSAVAAAVAGLVVAAVAAAVVVDRVVGRLPGEPAVRVSERKKDNVRRSTKYSISCVPYLGPLSGGPCRMGPPPGGPSLILCGGGGPPPDPPLWAFGWGFSGRRGSLR